DTQRRHLKGGARHPSRAPVGGAALLPGADVQPGKSKAPHHPKCARVAKFRVGTLILSLGISRDAALQCRARIPTKIHQCHGGDMRRCNSCLAVAVCLFAIMGFARAQDQTPKDQSSQDKASHKMGMKKGETSDATYI